MEAVRFSKTIQIFLIACYVMIASGCYVKSSITKIESPPPVNSPVSNAATMAKVEFVSTAKPYVVTPSSYRVRQSVGSLTGKQKSSTPQGYIVYQYVQGQISSDEVQ